jgi:NosR/NirI family transcriptional regulator, nitrous oxide reductase regulator
MHKKIFRACGLFFLAFFLANQAMAGMMLKPDLEKMFGEQFLVGDIQPGMPLWPLFAKTPPAVEAPVDPAASPAPATQAVASTPARQTATTPAITDSSSTDTAATKPILMGYAFETVDFEPVRGYGGKPINVLVVMDLQGKFLASKLLDHKEPLFRSEVRTDILTKFAEQYTGLTTKHNIQIYGFQATPFRDDKTANLHGIQAGTVTAKAIDKTILLSAASVALAHEEAAATGAIAGAVASTGVKGPQKGVNEHPAKLTWQQMLTRGMVSEQSFTRADLERPFAGTKAEGADKLAANAPNETALTVHVALVSLPVIGRNLLDEEGWRLLSTNRRTAQAIAVMESGPMARMSYESQRMVQELPFTLKQNGQELSFRGMSYDKGMVMPGYPDVNGRVHFLIINNATPLDPTQAFELNLTWGRRYGSFPTQVVKVAFPLEYEFNGWRTAVSNVWDTDWSSWSWYQAWQDRIWEIVALLAGLVVLTTGLIMQKRLSANTKRFKLLRAAYLLFTLGFIGWYAQGQLTIVNITAALDELLAGGDLSFFMNDPMSVILWLFVAGTLLVWGRGTFCGWLCPFGALQELISMVTQAVGIRQRRLRTAIDAKLKWIKYVVLAVIVGSVWASPSFAEVAVEIEPFKTAISLYFVREWPYVLWAVACVALSVFVYRGYCRYICPLGAALAATNVLQRWSWIPRREACGTPCQTCRHRCEYQAIEPTGKVNYSECFQCLDCVSIYQDDQRCLPLIQHRKDGSTFIPIHAGATA